MPLTSLPALLADDAALTDLIGRRSDTLAVPDPARALTIAALAQRLDRRPFLVAVATSTDAEHLVHDLELFMPEGEVELFPAWETLPFERVSPGVETMGRRLRVLHQLMDPENGPAVVVAPVRSLIQRLGPHVEDIEPVVVGVGDGLDPTELVERLVGMGYLREYQVEHRGEVAVRGSIVDVFPATADTPVRIDLWGDEVDRLTEFAVSDQRSQTPVAEVVIHAARELLPSHEVRERARELVTTQPWGREQWDRLADGQLFDGMESWLPWLTEDQRVVADLLHADAQIVLIEPRRIRDRAADLLAEEADLAKTLARTWDAVDDDGELHDLPRLHVEYDRILAYTEARTWTVIAVADGPDVAAMAAAGWDPVVGDDSPLLGQLRDLMVDQYRVVLCADGVASGRRMAELLGDEGIYLDTSPLENPDAAPDLSRPGGQVVVAPLDRGVVLPSAQLAVLGESDVTGRRRAHRRARPRPRPAQGFFDDLAPGDYVVHHHHGVARYAGMVKRAIGGNERDYLLLEYRGADKLYVPTDQIDAVRHYTGGEAPTLSKMGGADFAKAKAKVRSAVAEIAQELVVLYQKRITTQGHRFAPDTPWQRELEESFPFEETPDQLKAIEEVKADMEAERPMDRLVCGDVGFGKTEVALRSAFKAVQDGKQVAILVPTTLLAQQHHQTFSERFAGFPVRVEVLSRFLTAGQAKKVIQGSNEGDVDIVIGTHRMLTDQMKFKRLGLLIVDEEQRFGVSHKEKIKSFQADVDVLTLSATPIPRTLEMSLTGIRDLTLLNTPPAERQPILTYVGEYDERAVAEAIRRELLREGQVFFVHNRVQDIEHVAARLRDLVPEARLAVAHGQMDEGSLEQVVIDFWDGEYDVLVCTTIIESGIDMPTVNTLVVDRAERLGLGQLHQLRGRVGRAGQRAYAYLFTHPDTVLSEEAHERLKTIGEATELGSGFKIAMRDLEIRGAGNLLGTGQSGHIAAVGYDLYCQMVTEAVAELKGETIPEPVEITLDVPGDAQLPADYVSREDLRLEAYRRLAAVQTQTEVDDIRTEWEDRYGPVPVPAERLIDVARLRAEAARLGLTEVSVAKGPGFGGPAWIAKLGPIDLKASQTIRLERLYKGSSWREGAPDAGGGVLTLGLKPKADVAANVVLGLQDLFPPPESDGAMVGQEPVGSLPSRS
ncbi:MAG: transcription-repair coupling factor [Actinomycetia bacterium]|nr:transcription-repair coupling factor [Actinomycetes bacterium]